MSVMLLGANALFPEQMEFVIPGGIRASGVIGAF